MARLIPVDNHEIYPQLLAGALGPTMYIAPMDSVPGLPESAKYCLLSMGLGHNIVYSRNSPGSRVHPVWARIFTYRGHAIRTLNDAISHENTRASDNTIVSSITFLLSEVRSFNDDIMYTVAAKSLYEADWLYSCSIRYRRRGVVMFEARLLSLP
jgi:hypothetical protein